MRWASVLSLSLPWLSIVTSAVKPYFVQFLALAILPSHKHKLRHSLINLWIKQVEYIGHYIHAAKKMIKAYVYNSELKSFTTVAQQLNQGMCTHVLCPDACLSRKLSGLVLFFKRTVVISKPVKVTIVDYKLLTPTHALGASCGSVRRRRIEKIRRTFFQRGAGSAVAWAKPQRLER